MKDNRPIDESLESRRDTTPAVRRQVTWNEIGDSFEALSKVGLAMAIGMSAAGLFCRLADQGKVRVPSLSALLMNSESSSQKRKKTSED